MLLHWKIRYFDRTDKDFKDRWLVLDTETLEPTTRAAIDFVMEIRSNKSERDIVKHRKHFLDVGPELPAIQPSKPVAYNCFFLHDYFEDEHGNENSLDEIARIRSGNPNARVFPSAFPQHLVEFCIAPATPVPLAEITLSPEEFEILRVFTRDFNELKRSAFWTDGAGQITWSGPEPTIQTAISDEEIRSFVTIFRRLYMTKEPANFSKSVGVFTSQLGGHPIGKLVAGFGKEYDAALASTKFWPDMVGGTQTSFAAKNLIDAFIYTRFAHQPDQKRQQQYDEYLNQVEGKKGLLAWRFFEAIRNCAFPICNGGRYIAWWFDCYCGHHNLSANAASLRDENPGIGSQEKEANRRARVFREKVEALAEMIWRNKGRPSDGPKQFVPEAEIQLRKMLCDDAEGGSK